VLILLEKQWPMVAAFFWEILLLFNLISGVSIKQKFFLRKIYQKRLFLEHFLPFSFSV